MERKELEELTRKAQREYARAWRRKNPEKAREKNRRYWARKAQQMQQGGGETDAKAED